MVPNRKLKMDHKSLIKSILKNQKRRGNFKDYVLLTGESMIDYQNEYVVERLCDFEKDPQLKKPFLIHKKWLHRFIKDEQAKAFWNRTVRIRMRPVVNGGAISVK